MGLVHLFEFRKLDSNNYRKLDQHLNSSKQIKILLTRKKIIIKFRFTKKNKVWSNFSKKSKIFLIKSLLFKNKWILKKDDEQILS